MKRSTKNKRRKRSKKSSVKETIEAERKRESILGILIIFVIMVAVVAGGWYLLQPKGQGTSPESPSNQAGSPISEEHPGTLAPDFFLTDLDGNAFRLSDFKGSVVFIDFMATWCGPCRASMSELKALWGEYEGQVVMMSISTDPLYDTEDKLRDWMNEFEATWMHARDTADPPASQLYSVTSIPTQVIIDKDGYIRYRHVGVTPAETMSPEIAALLAE